MSTGSLRADASAHRSGKRGFGMITHEERRHIAEGARPHETPGGSILVDVLARGKDLNDILARCQEVLLAVLRYSGQDWPTAEQWNSILPGWFVAACAPEQSAEESVKWLTWWRTLPPAEQARAESEQPWTLPDWLHWLHPSERQWHWWNASATPDRALRVTIAIDGWPTALGSLDWLLRSAGATEVLHDESPVR